MIRESQSMSNDTHDYCWRMLPWFVTGRLSASDAQRLERHLEECSACRAELAEQRELCMHIRRDEALLLAPQSSLQKMMARIDAGIPNSGPEETTSEAIQMPRNRKSVAVRWLAIAAAVQTIALAALLTTVWQRTTDEMTAPRFATLSAPDAAKAEGTMFRVVFKPDTQAKRMQTLLQSVNAQVIAGPTEAGVYTLKLERTADAAATAHALAQVRADGSVIFVEHVSAERQP
jgi:anti-sigma factor RsiW